MRDLGEERFDDFDTLGLELTRPNRGLRLWLALHLHGVAAFRDALDEKLDLAVMVHEALLDIPGLHVCDTPDLSIVGFYCEWPEGTLDEANLATERLVHAVNDRANAFLSTTRIDGRVVARIAVLSLRTSAEIIRQLLTDIRVESGNVSRACEQSGGA
jgi:aromatic-L-amino-acid decarboxylase